MEEIKNTFSKRKIKEIKEIEQNAFSIKFESQITSTTFKNNFNDYILYS